jgi:WD40 repeat protein
LLMSRFLRRLSVRGVPAWLADFIFGFDYFLSYSHRDGLEYPAALARRLVASGFRVFLDKEIYGAGTDLRTATRRRARMSTYLIVIARPAAMRSAWVLSEVRESLAAGRTPIVIDVGGAYASADASNELTRLLADRLFIGEASALTEPSDYVVEELRKSFHATRREVVRLRVVTAVAVVLAVLVGISAWQYRVATRARISAEQEARRAVMERLAAQASVLNGTDPYLGGLVAAESVRIAQQHGDEPALSAEQAMRDALLSIGGMPVVGATDVLAVSGNGRWLVSEAANHHTSLWALSPAGAPTNPVTLTEAADATGNVAAFSPDNRWLVIVTRLGRTSANSETVSSRKSNVSLWALDRADMPRQVGTTLEVPLVLGTSIFSANGRWLLLHGTPAVLCDLTAPDPLQSRLALHRASGGDDLRFRFSPDQQWIGAISSARRLLLWRIPGTSRVGEPEFEQYSYSDDLHFSTNQELLLSSGDKLESWDIRRAVTGPVSVRKLASTGHGKSVFSPDSRFVATLSSDGSVFMTDRGSAAEGIRLVGPAGGFQGMSEVDRFRLVAFSADGQWFATTSHNELFTWTESRGFLLKPVDAGVLLWRVSDRLPWPSPVRLNHRSLVTSLAFSPDARWFVTGSRDGLRRWDMSITDYGKPSFDVKRLTPVERELARLAAEEDPVEPWRRLLADAFTEIKTGANPRILISASSQRMTTATADGAPRVWNLDSSHLTASPLAIRESGDTLARSRIYLGPRGRWLALSGSQALRLFDLTCAAPTDCEHRLHGHSGPTNHVAFDGEEQLVATGGEDGTIRVWDLTTPNQSAPLRTISGLSEIRSLQVSPDGKWLYALHGKEGFSYLYRLSSNEGPEQFEIEGRFSPDSRWFVAKWPDRTIRLADLASPSPFTTSVLLQKTSTRQAPRVFFDRGNRRIGFVPEDGDHVVLLDIRNGVPQRSTLAIPAEITPNRRILTDDGRRLVLVGHDGKTIVWSLSGAAPVASTIFASVKDAFALASSDGRWLVTWHYGAQLWDLAADEPKDTRVDLVPANQWVRYAAFSHDGKQLVMATSDGGILIWPLPTRGGQSLRLAHMSDVFGGVDDLVIAPGDQWIVTRRDTLLLWHLGPSRLTELIDRVVGRQLSPADRAGLGLTPNR